MYIQPYSENSINMYSWKNWKNNIKQKVLNTLPDATFENTSKKMQELGDKMSRPAQNRAIMGATAIVTQPTIDYYNNKVDKRTREVSRNRTIAKIIVGTLVGIMVRGSCYKAVEKMTDLSGVKNYSKSLIPKSYLKKFAKDVVLLQNYRSALSTSLAILAMCITNFAIDAPLTAKLTNKLNAKYSTKTSEGGYDV